jgi:hypothetical protein
MAISPLRSEEIAFEHPYVLVAPNMVRRSMTRKCNERRSSCKTRIWVALAAIGALAAFVQNVAAPVPAPVPAPVIVGGWHSADPNDAGIQAAARYAAGLVPQGHGALTEVTSAETQVVAGTNIRMVLRLADGSRWKATVWHRLDGTFALTDSQKLP